MSAAVQNDETFGRELATLFEKHYLLLYRAAHGITKSPQDADDVLQNVFLWLIENKKRSTDFIQNAPGYLYRCAIHEALKVVRSRARQRLANVDPYSLDIPAPAVDSDREEKLQLLDTALLKLKPEHLELIQLYYHEGRNCPEIAKMLGRSLPAVHMGLNRVRSEIEKWIQSQEGPCETRPEDQTGRRSVIADASEA